MIFGCLLCARDPREHHHMEPVSPEGLLKVIFLRDFNLLETVFP